MESVYAGSCHCQAIRFRVTVEKHEAVQCNCSICRKKGFLHLIVPPENFELISGTDALTTYKFNTEIASHTFCRYCGIHAFYRPRSHPEWFDVNLRCLDEDVISNFDISLFDGVNWEENVAQLNTEQGES
ncbi:GFA family protein [Merismopedia glauca]|uniref:Aldehyde-activating protein n=1 Tax=Merismopedia glauca CCAP 1448/3 TaxID=1296344 RepID=A0A2T1C6Q7_9CYAN|nr:GFA family protein [Merismopedia glauca]PSB03941.1 aldehyde-activating protein [Merismopedia glauca CCAP 1448/3]